MWFSQSLVRAALFSLGNPKPRVETRGYGYYTLSGYLAEFLLVINIRYILQKKCESCSPELPSLLVGKGWGWVNGIKYQIPRQSQPHRPWVVPGNNASEMKR